jgi:hypothetical protein
MIVGSVTTKKPKVYYAPGRCIYGSGPDHGGILTREHIIAKGLRGGFIFQKAICESCREMTQAFETACLRKMLLPYRLHAGWVTHRHDLPAEIPLLVNRDLDNPHKQISPHSHPRMLVMPIFLQPPGIMIGKAPDTRLNMIYQVFERRDQTVAPTPPGTRVALHFENVAFVRMLAKIAHGLAIGELGFDGIDPELPDLLFARNLALASYLIGCSNEDVPVPDDEHLSHQIGWGVYPWGDQLLVGVRIRLFAKHHTPAYNVIAGVMTPSARARFGLA